MPALTVVFCTYKRAERLEKLVAALRAQDCPVAFDILAVNNNSPDNTAAMLTRLAAESGAPLRYVTETAQGIVPARNRAIEESITSDIMVFIDDDELPRPGLLAAAYDAIVNEGAECAGGRVEVDFSAHGRPGWLGDDLLGFLARVDFGDAPLWVVDDSTPLWTANIAYDMRIFRHDADLRFDKRYNRAGTAFGGGEDVVMFERLLKRGTRMRYRPDMAVLHDVEPWRLHRGYFLRLHHQAGTRKGMHELAHFPHTWFGAPPFLYAQAARHTLKAFRLWLTRQPGALRQGMNASHAFGLISGYRQRASQRLSHE